MADNITLPGSGQVVATKEFGGAEYQVVLLADGSYTIVSPATSDDISNKDIMLALKSLIMAVANPSYIDKAANQIRSQVTGSVAVSSCTMAANQDLRTIATVTGITNLGSFSADHLQRMANYSAWAEVVRNKIS